MATKAVSHSSNEEEEDTDAEAAEGELDEAPRQETEQTLAEEEMAAPP